ncbi:urate oxidase [Cellulosimicrobium sp. BIT-GX5]|uniref:Uricase n=1 Tax=Cellulosimicrobium composti TaxID=2672572 RepID=A0A6N7ZI29_9MICO|nr:urate oxidase [Cellulosimicrobium composti]MTG89104.1 urate oxidase [Cellulosimicrobium composti]
MSETLTTTSAEQTAATQGSGAIVLGDNQWGKAEVRLVRVDRATPRHEITDLNVSSQLRGGQEATHLEGDNSKCVATDTQKNTIYAFARDGVGAIEDFAIRLGRHFVEDFEWIEGGRWEIEQYSWNRIETADGEHDHAFVRNNQETRTTVVQRDGDEVFVVSGLTDLVVLKSTGSEFHGFPRDRYTTLVETNDRILATSVTSRWRYTTTDVDFDAVYAKVRAIQLEAFATTHSLALQQTLFAMGKAVLEAVPEIAEIKFSMPNKHHFLVDLAPFGLDNPNEVFYAADRPYGLIEATVQREGVPAEPRAWATVTGFC